MNNEKSFNLDTIYNYVYENKYKTYEGWLRRYTGEILLNIDKSYFSDAESWIRQAIEVDQRNGIMFNLSKGYALYADFFKRKGDIPNAKEKLNKAIEICKKCGADGWVEKYEKELAAMM